MKTIRNTKLFYQLKKQPYWITLFNGDFMFKDGRIPVMLELDHIKNKENGIYFYGIDHNNIRCDFRIIQNIKKNKKIKRRIKWKRQ